MDFDPLTEGFPTRTALEEEEEEAEATAPALFEPALMSWSPAVRAALASGPLQPNLMVVAIGPAPCALMHHCAADRQPLGSIVLPEQPMAGNAAKPALSDATCFVYGIGGGTDVLLVQCQYAVPPPRAASWAAALLGSVRPGKSVVLAAALPSEICSGGGGGDTPLFSLATDAWAAAGRTAGPPGPVAPLPSGNVVGGLPARLLGKCQAMGMQACALVLRQPTPSPDALSLKTLAGGLKATLQPLQMAAVLGLDNEGALKAACSHVENAHWTDGVTGSVYL